MDLGSVLAVVFMVAIPAVWVVVSIVLWKMSRRLGRLESENEAHDSDSAPPAGRARLRP